MWQQVRALAEIYLLLAMPALASLSLPVGLFLQALPPAGIRIFASQLHTHLTGRKVVTVLSREESEREIVNADNHYSPHFQVQTFPR